MNCADQRITGLCLFMLCIGWAGMAIRSAARQRLTAERTLSIDGCEMLQASESRSRMKVRAA